MQQEQWAPSDLRAHIRHAYLAQGKHEFLTQQLQLDSLGKIKPFLWNDCDHWSGRPHRTGPVIRWWS